MVKAARLEDGKGPISLAAAGPLPQGVAVKPAGSTTPQGGRDHAQRDGRTRAAADTVFDLVITGTMHIGPQAVVRTLPAIPLRVSEK